MALFSPNMNVHVMYDFRAFFLLDKALQLVLILWLRQLK